MSRKSSLVQEQIERISSPHKDGDIKDSKSPTIVKLMEQDKVKKMRQIFEDKSSSNDHNTSIKSNSTKKSSSPSQIFRSLDCRRSSSKSPKNYFASNKIDCIIGELIQKEHEYMNALENGIRNYLLPISDPSKCHIPVPREIRLQKFKLFGNIEDIHRLHEAVILPQIIACEYNVLKVAQTFIDFVDNDTFYSYINYVIIHLHAKEMISSYMNFFKSVQQHCNDRLGVQSFILQPIQKLPRYPLLFEEMIKELSTEMQENKLILAKLCVAKKKLEKYLTRMNQALQLNDIVETHDLAVSVQYSALTLLQLEFHEDINRPLFLIVPQIRCFSDYRLPINVFDLGRFLTIGSFFCEEHEPYVMYDAEVFLFQKCLMYTSKCGRGDKNCLSYRDNFKFGPTTSIHLEHEQKRFTLGDIKANKIVTFTASSIEKAIQFYELIKKYQDQRKSIDSALPEDDDCAVDGNTVPSDDATSHEDNEDGTSKYAKNYNNIQQQAIDNEDHSTNAFDDGNYRRCSTDDDELSDFSGSDEFAVVTGISFEGKC